MIKLPALAALASLALAVPAYASSGSADDATPTADATAKPKDKMVCQRINETGSRGYKKVCQTEAQWRAQQEQDKRNLQERDRSNR